VKYFNSPRVLMGKYDAITTSEERNRY
jgi:hypothetical protein